jgi:hypothetical protein
MKLRRIYSKLNFSLSQNFIVQLSVKLTRKGKITHQLPKGKNNQEI